MSVRGALRSTWSFIRRYLHGPRMELSRANIMAALALLIICIVAVAIRLLPMVGFETMIRAFDPWYNLREVEYILENGFGAWFGWYDTTTWIPWGRNIPRSSYPGIPFTAALMFLAFQSLGISIDVMTVVVLFPAIMGVFGVIAIYALGVEVSSKEVGLLAAFFMAILPAYVQRTIAGFFDNEAVGILAILLTLFFFIRALRKGSIASAMLGGLSLGYLSASWSVYLYLFQIFAIFALVMVLLRRYSRRLLLSYSGVVLTGMAIAVCVPRIGFDWPTETTGLIPLGVWALLLLIELSRSYQLTEISFPGRLTGLSTRIRPYFAYIFGAMCALIVVGLGYLFQSGLFLTLSTGEGQGFLGSLAGKFYTVIDPLIRQNAFLLASVGEHLPSPWATFWYNLSFLILVMPFGFYIAFQRERETDILLIIFALTALYFTGSMIRLALILAPAAAILGSYGLLMAIRPFRPIFWQRTILTRRRRRITPPVGRGFASVAYLFLIVLLLASTITAIGAVEGMAGPEITPGGRTASGDAVYYRDYLDAFSWMQYHTPPGTVYMSWWDYGYWTRQVGDRFTVVDNATINKTQIAWVGRMFMETDYVAALRICQMLTVDYAFVHFGLGRSGLSGDEGKWQWMIRIAGEVFGDEVPDETYFWDPDTGQYLDPFFQTVIYNMLWLNASQVGVDPPTLNITGNPGPAPDLTTEPAKTIFSLFEPAYFSTYQFMKIFKCNYTYLESNFEITGASAYPVHKDVDPSNDLSQIVLSVKNTGLHPITIDTADIEYWNRITEEYDSITAYYDDITSDTGNLTINPDETRILSIRADPYFTSGTEINVTLNAAGFIPTLNTKVTVPVRSAPAWELSPIGANCWAYDNDTIYVELQNTGEGYLEVDLEGRLNDVEFSIENAILTRGRLLYSTEVLGITIDANYWGVDLVAGEQVNVLLRYMSDIPRYYGLNVTIPITIQATPSPPSPPSPTETNLPTSETELVKERNTFYLSYLDAVSPGVLFVESSSFFIFRRYEP
ncbi:MAG: STT3 domain-containing protein [Candidatus Thorarchaeota archaeon]